MVLLDGFEIEAQLGGPSLFIGWDSQYTDDDDMLFISCICDDDKGRGLPGASPLFD